MPDLDDQQLLDEFTGANSEAAFAALVTRYVNLVYSTALRFAGNPQAAEEISQAVFIILARKAASLRQGVVLSGWLYQTARLTAANYVKHDIRRQRREQEAYMQSTLNEPGASAWEEIAPLLDEAMGKLGETDRNAVVLRFFENKTSREVATALKMTEAAAHMRVHRALEKLRHFFTKRGIVSTTAIIAGAVSANSVHAAPIGLAKSVSAVAIAKGAAASASTATLVKGALKVMAWSKTQTVVAIGIGILLAGAVTTDVAVKKIAQHRDDELWARITQMANGGNWSPVETMPPTVSIRPTKFPQQFSDDFADDGKGRMVGLAMPASELFGHAYAVRGTRIGNPEMLPSGQYDFIVTIPDTNENAFQEAIKKRFGLVAKREPQDMDVQVLRVANPALPGLKSPGAHPRERGFWKTGRHTLFSDETISMLASSLEHTLGTPVVDQTGLTGHYNMDLTWNRDGEDPSLDEVKQAVLNQLGLELVPANMPIEMLVVEKAE